MDQNKEKLLSQKHTGFEDFLFYSNINSLSLSADFFFVHSLLSPDSETNEISSTLTFSNSWSANRRPFLCDNLSKNE
jgi:hypothetical protein